MRFLVIGSGGVGLGLSAFLLKAGCEVCLFSTRRSFNSLTNYFKVDGIFGDFTFKYGQYDVIDSFENLRDKFDWVLITTKTYANEDIARQLCDFKDKLGGVNLVVVQNGWGNAEKFLRCFDKESVFSARIITGFYRKAPNEVEITVHADKMVLGNIFRKELSGQTQEVVDALNNGGFDALVSEDVDKHLWAKLLYNCALNPLGAILRVEYGKLAEKSQTRKIMDRIINEIFDVMRAYGYETFFKNANEYKDVFYSKLVPSTYSHRSSMLQDIENSQKTEIDSLNGVVVELAKKKGLAAPYNEFIVELIKAIEP
ncbi:ketopantoate reductase family protein [Hippea maritima]|uniref:2-dehydropantoate 2-reductase n=1 Tax=Hippea maritima (strain ATCC 700847 / DSM 10411 / MH2) TaxID=760142 RepID=F2LWA1_HIPMA|nr:2-dehydropantoate 2-reductase [Hippea maritima]AEA34035.1 2-dehydropantoate 2-reductase [Hippea maritima DSM 10411]